MVDLWLHDIESLEAVTQDEPTRPAIAELAADARFLLTVDEYVRRTQLVTETAATIAFPGD